MTDLTNNDQSLVGDKTVTKRSGDGTTTQPMSVEKIRTRLERLLEGLASKHINLDIIVNKVCSYAQNGKWGKR